MSAGVIKECDTSPAYGGVPGGSRWGRANDGSTRARVPLSLASNCNCLAGVHVEQPRRTTGAGREFEACGPTGLQSGVICFEPFLSDACLVVLHMAAGRFD